MRVLLSTYDSYRGVEPLLGLAVRVVISREEPPAPA
jgi:hypothetical protein